MNKKLFKGLALILAVALAMGMASVALADTSFTPASGTAYATEAVNVRTGPGTSYSVLGYLNKGEKVTITGTVNNGWTQIKLPGGALGYVSGAYLSSYYPSGNSCPVVNNNVGTLYKVNTGALNVRRGPGTNYGIVSTLQRGDQVTCIGQSGKWFKIATSDGSDAWVSSSYLTSVNGNSNVIIESNGTMYATTGVNVRSGPSTSYSIVGGLNRGDKVTKTGTSGNWTRIAWGSGSAYVYSKYLQSGYISGGSSWVSPGSGNYIRYATTLINVRQGPGTEYALLGTVSRGQSLTCVGTSGSWTKVIWGSGYGYVYTGYLTSNYYNTYPDYWGQNVIYGSNSVYMQQDASLFSAKNMSTSYYVRTLPAGTRATLLSMDDGWAKIQYNGSVYYTWGSNLAYAY